MASRRGRAFCRVAPAGPRGQGHATGGETGFDDGGQFLGDRIKRGRVGLLLTRLAARVVA